VSVSVQLLLAGGIQSLDFGFYYFLEIVHTLCIMFESTVLVLD
jgi:hypothetical protein